MGVCSRPPSEQSSPMQDERLETSRLSLARPVSLPVVSGRRPYPALITATAEKRPASLKPPPGKVARTTTGILKPRTRVQRAQCRLRWYLRIPVPLLMPLQSGSPRKLWLGEASESTVRSSTLLERCLTPSRPYPSSHSTRLIIFSRHLPLNGFNFHGIAALLMSVTASCYLTGGGADRP